MTRVPGSIRVIVVDDQQLVRAGFAALLDAAPEIEVVAEANNGQEAVELARRHRLDLVLMDIRMPGLNGIDATVQIRNLPDPPEVLILTTFDTDENAFDALAAGAAGFLVKDTPPAQLLDAVRSAVAGGAVISPATTRRLVDHLVAARLATSPSTADRPAASPSAANRPATSPSTADRTAASPSAADRTGADRTGADRPAEPGADQRRPAPPALDSLTDREQEVLALVARGCSNREISARLHIAELTTKTHVSRILTKLGLDSRVQAAALAYQTGLVRPGA